MATLTIDKEKLIELKNKIRSEMKRRSCAYGSLESYSTSEYDFEIDPITGEPVLHDFGEKVINLALKINDIYIDEEKNITFANINQYGDYCDINFIEKIEKTLDTWEQETMKGNVSSCRGQCTGLCAGSCSSECGGCTGSCTGCSGTCTTTCGKSCVGGCGTGCTSSCGTTCAGGCIASCKSGCSGECESSCARKCETSCTSTCINDCDG